MAGLQGRALTKGSGCANARLPWLGGLDRSSRRFIRCAGPIAGACYFVPDLGYARELVIGVLVNTVRGDGPDEYPATVGKDANKVYRVWRERCAAIHR